MKKHFLKIQFVLLSVTTYTLFGQSSGNLESSNPKSFTNRVEVLIGPNLSLNNGNMFIENYRGEYEDNNYVSNKRLLKTGYQFGAGFYHSLGNKIDLNIRLLYEQKGTKNELNNPLNPVNDDTRQITLDEYDYNYLTLNVSPFIYLGPKGKWSISVGLYYSKIKNLKGSSESYNTRDNQVLEGSFEGRYFYHLREDGGMDGFSWNPYLTSIETYDFGMTCSASHRVSVNQKYSILIQLQGNYGLQNINKDNPYGLREKNHSIAFIISYSFKLPPKN